MPIVLNSITAILPQSIVILLFAISVWLCVYFVCSPHRRLGKESRAFFPFDGAVFDGTRDKGPEGERDFPREFPHQCHAMSA